MHSEFPKMLYWQGGRSQGRVVQDREEEIASNKEGWFIARPLDDNGNPIWPGGKDSVEVALPAGSLPATVELVALAPKTSFMATEVDFNSMEAMAVTPEPTKIGESAANVLAEEEAPPPVESAPPVEVFVSGEPVVPEEKPKKAKGKK